MFEDEVALLRAEAAAEVGPYEEAAAYFAKTGRVRDLVRAAKALAKTTDRRAALAMADRALVEAQRLKRSVEERGAHAVRADILVTDKRIDVALTDLKWLATKAPASAEGRAARKTLQDNDKKLSDKEVRDAIDALLEAGAGKDALELLEQNPKAFSKAEMAHRKAEAMFKSRSYAKAAEAFVAASKQDSGRTDEQIYMAGRALARSKKEDDAVTRYREVIRRFRKSMWAERASYQLAQLLLGQGKYAEAADAFTSYLSTFPKGTSRNDAEYALSLALLSAGKPDRARTVFSKMAGRAKKTEYGVYRQLEGVAALRAGAKDDAIAIFSQVASDQPLTWAALASRARLSQLGAPLPPLITPAAAGSSAPLDPPLPSKAAQLIALGLDADAEAYMAENEGPASAAFQGRETEALCLMYGKLSRAKRRYKVGAAAVSFQELMRAPTDSERWMWNCLYPSPYGGRVTELEGEYSIPAGLVHSLMRQESAFDPEARSPVGAEGLMQLMPTTAQAAAKEVGMSFDPREVRAPEVNLRIGSFYIGKLLKTFDGSVPLAVAGYNAGPTAVSRWVEMAKEHEADVFVARIPYTETRNYVVRVMGNLARYQWLSGGEAAVLSLPLELPSSARAANDDY
jgi:soluble lytic murein transglycosylase